MGSYSTRSSEKVFSAPTDLRDAVGANRTMVDAPGDAEVVRARIAEVRLEEGQGSVTQVGACDDAEAQHLGLRRRPDAVKSADRQALHEARASVRRK